MQIFNRNDRKLPKLSTHQRVDDDFRTSLLLWMILLSIGLLTLWASMAELDTITRAQGQVIASSRTQIIQSPDGGILEDMLVKEGDSVVKGQVLARLDRAKVEAAYFEAQAKVAALQSSVARLRAEVFGGEPNFNNFGKGYPQFRDNQLLLLKKRQRAISEELTSLEGLQEIAKKELEMNMPLLKAGDVSMADILKLQRQVADIGAQIINKRNKYAQDTQAEFSKAEEDLASAHQALVQRKDQLDHVDMKSPTNGIVKNVRITTLGGVIKAGEEVMQIVPIEDSLIVEAKVKPSDVAFLKPGLDANVKIDSYDYTVYGTLNGKLVYISADTLTEDLKQGEQAYYRVQVKTQGKRFSGRPKEELEIQPGMTATIEIKIGKNTVLKYIFKPVIKTLSESLGER